MTSRDVEKQPESLSAFTIETQMDCGAPSDSAEVSVQSPWRAPRSCETGRVPPSRVGITPGLLSSPLLPSIPPGGLASAQGRKKT